MVRPTRNNSPNPDTFMPVIETLPAESTATLLSRTKPEEAEVMDGVIGFLLGIFVGSSFGVFTMALLIAAKWEDRQLAENGRWENGENDTGRND